MSDFTALTTPTRIDTHTWEAAVPDGWQQGRGAFGGLVLAILTRTLECEEGGHRPLRSLSAQLVAPVLPGSVQVRADLLRRSRNVSTYATWLFQHGEVVAHATGVLAASRGEQGTHLGIEPPAMPPWRDVPVVPVGPPRAPAFARHCEFRPAGAPPFSGVAETTACGWVRLHRPGPVRNAAEVMALVDAWWPAHFAGLAAPQAIATVAFTLDLVGDVAAGDRDAPACHRGRILAGQQGYLVEQRELWSEDGRLLAVNQQTIAQLG